jgi:hypothetical protein
MLVEVDIRSDATEAIAPDSQTHVVRVGRVNAGG